MFVLVFSSTPQFTTAHGVRYHIGMRRRSGRNMPLTRPRSELRLRRQAVASCVACLIALPQYTLLIGTRSRQSDAVRIALDFVTIQLVVTSLLVEVEALRMFRAVVAT